MQPLSLLTYYRRHKGHTALLLGIITLVTVGLYLMVALSWAIFVEPARTNRQFLSKLNIVMPYGDEWAATVMAQVRAYPGVEQVIPFVSGQGISLPEVIGGGTNWFGLWGVREEDVKAVMEKCGATLKEGHPLQPRTNGIMLSEGVAAALGLHVGDVIHHTVNPEFYSNIADPLEVVAILESDIRLGILSAEYMNNHEIYQNFPIRFMVAAQQGHEAEVDAFLRNEIQSSQTVVWTLQTLNEQMVIEYRRTLLLIIPLIVIVATAVGLVIGTVNNIAFSRRIPEFGILHAAGYSRRWLTYHLTAETTLLAFLGWILGILLAWAALYGLKLAVFAPRGHTLSVVAIAPGLLVLLVPLAVVGFAQAGFRHLLTRMDAVTIIERGELGPEEQQHRLAVTSSLPRPLSAATFFHRHRRRAALLIGAMTLMIIAVALVIFFFSATSDAQRARLGNLVRMSSIQTRFGAHVDMGIIALVRTNPTVDRVIPCAQMTMLDITIPPFERVNINPYGVYAEDIAYLVDLYGLKLKEGHLPRPNTNELVIPEIVAQNRNLHIGDMIGNRERPAYPGAMSLPADFVISGIFARSNTPEDENWLAFFSLEFLQDHEAFSFFGFFDDFLVVPKTGQKAAMDDWLETEINQIPEIGVITYDKSLIYAREGTRTTLLTMALIESGVVVVAATALAVLNIISVAQRQVEFGLLHALGLSRSWLVARTVRETAFTTGVAWCISAFVCLTGLLFLQLRIFNPLGLRLKLFSLTPWLFTLPIPVAVLVATIGTVSRTLSKLDPVDVIERR
jgi:ABC-type lipoprotein release transport system permease subunit